MSDRLKFYPWNISATGSWSVDTGLHHLHQLRDLGPKALAALLWTPGIYVRNTAIIELMMHGNPQKAAQVARELVEQHPICEKSIQDELGTAIANYLLVFPLDQIPRTPEEYSADVDWEYIQ